jgi:DNA-binding response OmpR family regulator
VQGGFALSWTPLGCRLWGDEPCFSLSEATAWIVCTNCRTAKLAENRIKISYVRAGPMEKSINFQFRPILRSKRPGNLAKSSQSSDVEPFPVAPHSQSVAEIVAIGSILVIENDATSVKALQRLFACEGYEFRSTSNGKEGLEMFVGTRPDAVILDLLLPGLSGRDICRSMKQISFDIPVIILSAISDVADKVLLLEFGADDYVTKPFSPRELLARVQAAIRRSKRLKPHGPTAFGNIQIDFGSMRATKNGMPVMLTAHEFKLFRFFIDNPERVLTRDELLKEVWGYNAYPSTRTVDNQVLKLRQKFEDNPAEPFHFCTVHGVGYRFVPLPQR